MGVLDRNRQLHEVTTFRRDIETDGRHAVVQYGVSLEDDLARRDFTINALAYHPLREEWRDPSTARTTCRVGVVRAVGDAAQRFREDYLRILRGLRFSARLGFAIDPATWDAARAATDGLPQLSAERVRDEWFKSLRTARDLNELVRLWRESGVAAVWMPELDGAAGATTPAVDRKRSRPRAADVPAHQRSRGGAAPAQGIEPGDWSRASRFRSRCRCRAGVTR